MFYTTLNIYLSQELQNNGHGIRFDILTCLETKNKNMARHRNKLKAEPHDVTLLVTCHAHASCPPNPA